MLKQDKEFGKIVKFHDQMIKSLISQKARGDQSFNDQTEEIRATLAIPSNKFLDWAKSLDMFIKTVINSKINDMELLNKYKEFVKELIEYQSQNDDIAQKLQDFNQDYDMLTNIVIKLENKIAQIRNSTGMVDEKIRKLQEQLRDAQETISTQADTIEDLENELEEERRNKRKTTTREKVEEEDYEDAPDADDVDAEDETEQAWNNILGDEPVKKKHDDEEQDNYDDEDDIMEENTDEEQEEDDEIKNSIQEDDGAEEDYEVKKKIQPKREVKIMKHKFAYTEKNLKLFYFVHERGTCFTLTSLLKDVNDKKIHEKVYSKSGVWRFLQTAVKAGDIYEFGPTSDKYGHGSAYYSPKQKPDDLPHPFVMSERSLKAIRENDEIFENTKK
jgi:hypothetical protein